MKRVLVTAVIALGILASGASPAAAAGCTGDHPYEKTNARFRGFLVVCSDLFQRSLVIQNESRIVYSVSPVRGSTVQIYRNPEDSLVGEATRLAAPATCVFRRCTLQPGGSATAFSTRGDTLANALIDPDAELTRVTLSARLVAGQIQQRLQSRAQRNIGALMACANSIANTTWRDGWEFAFRAGVDLATTCPSLVRSLYSNAAEEVALASRVSRLGSKIIGQEGFVDVVLSGIKAIIRR